MKAELHEIGCKLRLPVLAFVALGFLLSCRSSTPKVASVQKSAGQRNSASDLASIRKAADQGSADAQYNLGVAYCFGKGVPQDYAQAAIWYRKAADQGSSDAQYSLGVAYYLGKGVPQDYAQAAIWYRRAADQGSSDAQGALGAVYNLGRGVPQDYAQSAIWYRKAAEQGLPGAQVPLGQMYYTGMGVPQDYVQSYFWLDLAATGNNPEIGQVQAAKERDLAASHLTVGDLSQVQERARLWLESHPEQTRPAEMQEDIGVPRSDRGQPEAQGDNAYSELKVMSVNKRFLNRLSDTFQIVITIRNNSDQQQDFKIPWYASENGIVVAQGNCYPVGMLQANSTSEITCGGMVLGHPEATVKLADAR